MGDRNAAELRRPHRRSSCLTLYALAMIAPDFLRVARPLGSFGLSADGDGLIYDVQGPFATEEDSPAWRAGLRRGDRLDLAAMRCIPVDTNVCASLLSLWAGVNYVMPGREATLLIAATGERPAREVALVAEPRPSNRLLELVVASRDARRDPGRARRGLAGLDASGRHDLGLLRLCDPVQSRPGVPVLRLASAMASGAAGSGRRFARDAGCGLCRAHAVRAQGAGRPGRRPMARDRTRAAGACDPVLGTDAGEPRNRLRLSRRDLDAKLVSDRFRGQRLPRSRSFSDVAGTCRRATTSGSAGSSGAA